MAAKVLADRESRGGRDVSPSEDAELEAEVQAVAAWFETLPKEWQRYFDQEAESGRRAYGPR